MRIFIQDVLQISLDILPEYAKNSSIDKNKKRILKNYWKSLKSTLGKMQSKFEKLIIKSESIDIKLEEFVKMFEIDEMKVLVSPKDLRLFALETYEKNGSELD